MKKNLLVLAALAAPLVMMSAEAGAKGCLKGAAVGGVAGHVAGQHAVLGAAAGCAVEHHREKVRDKKAAQQAPAAPANGSQPVTNGPSQ